MAKLRRSASRNWARGFFAFFSILLAGASGLYLFTLATDPSAFGDQVARANTVAPDAASRQAPAPTAALPAMAGAPEPGIQKKLAEISAGMAALTRQVASLDTRLKPIEKFVGPVAALPPATSVTTSPPDSPAALAEPDPIPDAPPEPQAATAAPSVPEEAAPAPDASPPEPATAEEPMPEPEPMAEEPMAEPEPVEQAAVPAEIPPPEAQPEEPVALAAPLDPMPAHEGAGSAEETQASPEPVPAPTAAPVESAALDPTTLPPAANDGTTRYGIELGIVAKQDGLRPLWREFLTNHAALVAGLQPRRVLAPDKKWRLIAGPFSNAEEAAQACALFKKVSRPCEATVYAGDRL